MEGIVSITPNKEKAQSILKMVDVTMEMLNTINRKKFPSNVVKDYYEVIRELMSVILLLDGYKTVGEGAHKNLIVYLEQHYKQFRGDEISLINDLRIVRNKIAYDGFFVRENYLDRRLKDILGIIAKSKEVINEKLT